MERYYLPLLKGLEVKCPHCNDTVLVMTERQGIEIDYCPQCRGVWLDRGELDKLIERGSVATPAPSIQSQPYPAPRQNRDFEDSDFRRHAGHGHKKQKSWLSDIFD